MLNRIRPGGPFLVKPSPSGSVSSIPATEYQWGTHQQQIHGSQIRSFIIAAAVAAISVAPPIPPLVSNAKATQAFTDSPSSLFKPIVAGQTPPIVPFVTNANGPQLLDFTIQGSLFKPLVGSRPKIGAFATNANAPQIVDLSTQGWIEAPEPLRQGPVPPLTIGKPQADPTQIAAQFFVSAVSPPITPNPIAGFFSTVPQFEERPTNIVLASVQAGQTPPVIQIVQSTPQRVDLTQQGAIWTAQSSTLTLGPTVKPLPSVFPQPDLNVNGSIIFDYTPLSVAGVAPVITGIHQVNMSVSFGVGLSRMGTTK
jgi:hypothetical protein